MNQQLYDYFDDFFASTAHTKQNIELKEELLSDAQARYDDLMNQGKTEEEALQMVIEQMGDIRQLISMMEINTHNESNAEMEEKMKEKKKLALVTSICVGIYIFSFILFLLLSELGRINGTIAIAVWFGLSGLATCVLVYFNSIANKNVKESKNQTTVYDEFKDWKEERSGANRAKKIFQGIFWPVIVFMYLAISMLTGRWGITWIIWPCAAAVSAIIDNIL